MTDKEKWNSACDALFQHLNRPIDAKTRFQLRGDRCCKDFEQVKAQLLQRLNDIRL